MKKLLFLLFFVPLVSIGNDLKIPSKIEKVTVYLSGAQVYRTAECKLSEGANEIVFTGLSPKIVESSIQVSGLKAVSILSLSYDLNYLEKTESNPQVQEWEDETYRMQHDITMLKNHIIGLEEEEKIITTNRTVSANDQALNLENIKKVSAYYRERITAIKNEIFETNLKINKLNLEMGKLRLQLAEANNAPQQEQGELTIKFDTPVATNLKLSISYLVNDAGWIPNYDIKSEKLNAPVDFTYKAHVYQKTGKDWDNVNITLSTGNPDVNVSKPHIGTKYLNFVSRHANQNRPRPKMQGYIHNPTVRTVTGTVVDESGTPLPGANVMIKGTDKGTQADFDGNFSLDVASGRELRISYIGFLTHEVPIYSSVINIQMEEDVSSLDEVVVVGYGNTPGRTSGVKIRGNASVQAPRPPLYIIDGVPVDGFTEGDLDENEIQSMEVLKGNEASLLYGSRGSDGIVVITTKKSSVKDDLANTKFVIKKAYSIVSDGDITAIEISSFQLPAEYEYFAAPLVNEHVFLTAKLKDWEKHQLLPGEANVYFEGGYAGKTNIDPYTVKKEMILSMGTDPNITVTRNRLRNFKSKSFTGSNRILDRTYDLEIKNNKNLDISLKLVDRIPISQNKEIKVDAIDPQAATYDKKTGLLTWNLKLDSKESKKESFSFQVKYPRGKYISL